jgi:anti-anti-sigma factor
MPAAQLNAHRRDKAGRALITLSGEIDLYTAPQLCASMEDCLRDGIRTIDVDLGTVTFCDCSGLNVFLRTSQRVNASGGSFQLHHASPLLTRIVDITGSGFLLLGLPQSGRTPAQVLPPPPHEGTSPSCRM